MDFVERIEDVSKRLKNFDGLNTNEEATKSGLVMPFIAALGYDVFNPNEVAPEYSAPIGQHKDARVDYAILADGKPIIIIECKALGVPLETKQCNQLQLYFHGTESRIAILTDGNRYLFYSDLDAPNKMDAKPFMEIELANLDKSLIPELRKLAKGKFDCDSILTTAQELKYNREFRVVMEQQFKEVDEDFLSVFVRRVYDGKQTNNALARFKPILQSALSQFLDDEIDRRLDEAKRKPKIDEQVQQQQEQREPEQQQSKISTTPLELEAFYLVKSLLVGIIEPERIAMRDAINFCNILLDDSIQKPIFRLYFNNESKLRVATFDNQKNEEKIDINTLDDILTLAEKIRQRAKAY